jgi:hypothetical protein
MVVFAVLPLRYTAPFPLINPGRPQFCFAFHARDYPSVGDTSEGGVQRTLTLLSRRVYKEAWTEDNALEEIRSLGGVKFDPELVEIFFEVLPSIRQITERYEREE